MPSTPRILRAVPEGEINRPPYPLPVLARIRWLSGEIMDVPGTATAWTLDAVRVIWEWPGHGFRSDWLPAADVRRTPSRRFPDEPGATP
jgi:hypothetical protein